ncbi:MAG: choice-of-anchor B family protein [Bacteroidetes bacterium]|nr:choice-of-anchor B family protein [Bacteroidota bacterium]
MTRTTILSILILSAMSLTGQEEAVLLGTWSDAELVGSNTYNNIYNEVWGIHYGGREYAVVGSTAGTHFIDVTNPATAFEAHFVAGAESGGHIIHRDFHDQNGYLYAVADEGNSSLQIIDFRGLPDAIDVVYDSDALMSRSHNIFIEGNTLYAFATYNGLGGSYAMRLYDISNPVLPVFVAEYNKFGDLTAGHVHDAYVRNNIAFLNCGGDGMAIVDFTNRLSPLTLFTLKSYPHQGYNHSGWLTDDGNYYYMADETHAADLKVMDVSDPCNATVIDTFNAEVSNIWSITHNQIVACDYLYTSYYYEGLQIFDISDPTDPQKILYYDTYTGPDQQYYKGAWGVYPLLPSGNILVSDMQSGLFIVEGPGDNCYSSQVTTGPDVSCRATLATTSSLLKDTPNIFPQPATAGDRLTISGLNLAFRSDWRLTRSDGSLLKTWTEAPVGEQVEIELPENLTPGIYFLSIAAQNEATVLPVSIY